MDLSQRALETNVKLFSNFQFLAEDQNFFKGILRSEYWSNCNVLYMYQWISLDKLYKLMESLFFFLNSFFELLAENSKNILTNSDVWITIKVQYSITTSID